MKFDERLKRGQLARSTDIDDVICQMFLLRESRAGTPQEALDMRLPGAWDVPIRAMDQTGVIRRGHEPNRSSELRARARARALTPQLQWQARKDRVALTNERKRNDILTENSKAFVASTKRLHELARVEDGWGVLGGKAPTRIALSTAYQLVEAVFLQCQNDSHRFGSLWGTGLMPDGGLLLEWRKGGKAVEVEVSPDGHLNYLMEIEGDIVEDSEEDGVGVGQLLEVLVRSVM